MKPTTLLSVLLPDGNTVEVSSTALLWWTTQDASGYVDPTLLAHDPKQPRKHMNEERLGELQQSVQEGGVRESITVTPIALAPWVKLTTAERKNAFFLIVSGHRRQTSATLAGLKAVPVKVKIYANEKEHRMDVSLLNKGREDLSDLEEGYEAVELRTLGWTIPDLCKHFGLSAPGLYARINLTRLHPDIQALLSPKLGERKRLPTTTGGALGAVPVPTEDELEELQIAFFDILTESKLTRNDFSNLSEDDRRFHAQKMLLAVIQKRGLAADRALNFIKERRLQLSASHGATGRKAERFRPSSRREIIATMLKEVTGSVVVDWKQTDFERIFGPAAREDVEDEIAKLEAAAAVLSNIRSVLQKIRDSKKPTRPETLAIIRKKANA